MKLTSAPLIFNEIPTPATPASGEAGLFIDAADGKAKAIKSSGATVDLESSSGSADADQGILASQIFT